MKMERRQFVLLLLTIAALGFLTWQIFRLIHNDISAQNRANDAIAKAQQTAATPVALPQPTTIKPAIPTAATATATATTAAATPTTATPNNEYVALIDQYQLLQMQHKLLDEKLAIAKLNRELEIINQQNAAASAQLSPQDPDTKTTNYQLVYLAQENQQWTATVVKDSHYQTVQAGDELDDGSKVLRLDKQGLVLQNGTQQILLTFNDVKVLPSIAPSKPQPAPAAAAITKKVETDLTKTQQQQQSISQKQARNTSNELDLLDQAEQRVNTARLPSVADLPNDDNAPFTLDEILLLELPADNYTIKLTQTKDQNSLQKLVSNFHLNPQAMQFAMSQDNKAQHVLVFGNYHTKDEAEEALNTLPPTLLKLSPQIITLSTVQQVIRSMR